VFEAGPENLAFKRELFQKLEKMAPAGALLASNTSVMPITDIMQDLTTGHRAMGTHWWNPPYLVPLVEVIKTADTDPDLAQQMFELLSAVGKTPAMVEKDVPGFIGNRLQHALWREAVAIVAEGICDARTVDTVVKASFGRRLPVLGPLENADLVGTELTLAIHQIVLPAINSEPAPSPYLQQLIDAGRLGMKSGEGFRTWSAEEQAELRARVLAHLKNMNAAEGR
jgi:3-hydroxybutyryl-CoA dehydrogenase